MYGRVEYNRHGKPKCEICGEHFTRVVGHVRQKHFINEREYKIRFGFDLGKGICSQQSSELSRRQTLKNYDRCITNNFKKGENTQFKKGHKGRTKDQVSEQTRIALGDRLKGLYTTEQMRERGRLLGLKRQNGI